MSSRGWDHGGDDEEEVGEEKEKYHMEGRVDGRAPVVLLLREVDHEEREGDEGVEDVEGV